jgi:uncharacterized membrane protein
MEALSPPNTLGTCTMTAFLLGLILFLGVHAVRIAIVVGLGLYGWFVISAHGWLFGMPLMPQR